MLYDVIIIGGGAAGLGAALYTSRGGMKTLVIEKLSYGGQAATTHEIDNYLGFTDGPSGMELGEKMHAHAKQFGAEFVNETVKTIENADDSIKRICTRRNVYETRTIIFATGAKPRKLEVPGEEELRGAGVSYCATCDGAFFKGQTAVVVGGGNTAFEDALYLANFCSQIYLVHRSRKFRAAQLLVDKVTQNPKIELLTDYVITKIQGDTTVQSVVLSHTMSDRIKRLDTAAVFIAVGSIPESALAGTVVHLNEQGFIVTDREMKTNVKGIYAAGDVRDTPLRQVITAAADGAVAANSAILYVNG